MFVFIETILSDPLSNVHSELMRQWKRYISWDENISMFDFLKPVKVKSTGEQQILRS